MKDVRQSHCTILENIDDGLLNSDSVLRELLGWLSADDCDHFLEHLQRYGFLPDDDEETDEG